MVGTADSALIREVSLIRSVLCREVPLYNSKCNCIKSPVHQWSILWTMKQNANLCCIDLSVCLSVCLSVRVSFHAVDIEHSHVRFLGNLVLNLWDCGG